MDAGKVRQFMALAGQEVADTFRSGTPEERKLGAQLLLSEVLEYVIHGLGVIPKVGEVPIQEPDQLTYHIEGSSCEPIEMIDGLADVAYTMYWNACAFGVPLDEAYELVCDNNLEKFVKLSNWQNGEGPLPRNEWSCDSDVSWPVEVVRVDVLKVEGEHFAVGKDSRGKVRKPSHYRAVDLEPVLKYAMNGTGRRG